MLTAIVMVCSLVTQGDCMQFTDSRGPYKTEEQCMARIEEMVKSVTPTLPPVPKQFYFRCADVEKSLST